MTLKFLRCGLQLWWWGEFQRQRGGDLKPPGCLPELPFSPSRQPPCPHQPPQQPHLLLLQPPPPQPHQPHHLTALPPPLLQPLWPPQLPPAGPLTLPVPVLSPRGCHVTWWVSICSSQGETLCITEARVTLWTRILGRKERNYGVWPSLVRAVIYGFTNCKFLSILVFSSSV